MRLSIFAILFVALVGLTACEPTVPDSGVGFEDYDNYSQNTAQAIQGSPIETGVISDENVSSAGISMAIEEAVMQTPELAGTAATAAVVVRDTSAISNNQDFASVSQRESIESDAERLAAQRAQYQEIQPTELPKRSGKSSGSAVIKFALATDNPVGQPIYSRPGSTSVDSFNKACSKFQSSNQAQEDFLSNGGPKKDRKGLDPDGDGFACAWDPTPFRAARQG